MEWTDYDNDFYDDPWLLRLVGPVLFTTVNNTPHHRSLDHSHPHHNYHCRGGKQSNGIDRQP